jgi:starch phosphorylase
MLEKALNLIKLNRSNEKYLKDITEENFFGYPLKAIIEAEDKLQAKEKPSIAYFSMEYGLAPSIYHTFSTVNPISPCNVLSEHEVFSNMKDMDYYHFLPIKKILDLPIYSGGLGVLAGDSLKSAADLGISLAGIGILWNKGYFQQRFWFRAGGQAPEVLSWEPESYPGLIPLEPKISITFSGQRLTLKLWKYYIYSHDLKNAIPLVLMDADDEENPPQFRELTYQLYRSTTNWIKLGQRLILGAGGVKALEALGYCIDKYHLNEGHAAFAFVEMAKKRPPEEIKKSFFYTCHTPVEAGHDRFSFYEFDDVLSPQEIEIVRKFGTDEGNANVANLTLLAMNTCQRANAVAKKHGEVTHLQFPRFKDKISSITNGIHTHTWISDSIRALLLKYKDKIGDWESDPTLLSKVADLKNLPDFRRDLWAAHLENKKALVEFLRFWYFDEACFTLGWARRIAPYKRPTLLFQDTNRLIEIAKKLGPLQVVIAGKAHPADVPASVHMDEMMEKINMFGGERKMLRICFLENYDTYFAKLLTSSVDMWLNTPLPPFEASGTSGMKAIVNGVAQLSTLDGWIAEAADKNIGKIFGYVPVAGQIGSEHELRLTEDSRALYEALEEVIPMYYNTVHNRETLANSQWINLMIDCIVQSGYFNTHRMLQEYCQQMWKI